MHSFAGFRETTNPYLKQLVDATSSETVEVATFSWRAALLGQFEVLHVHWPEVLLRGASPAKTWARRILFAFLLLRVKLGHKALVRTLHNIAPHEGGPEVERRLLQWCDGITTLWIKLVESTPVPLGRAPAVTIAHGDYRAWFADHPVGQPIPGRLLYFGVIRPYKGISELMSAFDHELLAGATLRLCGAVKELPLATEIAAYCDGHPTASAHLGFLSDDDLADEVSKAALVVLPYREMHNSGAALLALSLGRPILVPDNQVTRELQAEVGTGWVRRFSGALTAADLAAALEGVAGSASWAPPNLSQRDWAMIGAAHLAAYARAAASACVVER